MEAIFGSYQLDYFVLFKREGDLTPFFESNILVRRKLDEKQYILDVFIRLLEFASSSRKMVISFTPESHMVFFVFYLPQPKQYP